MAYVETEAAARARRKYRRTHKGKNALWKAQLKRIWHLTPDDYVAMLTRQNLRCAICNRDKCGSGKRFSVDHCHTSGKIRGLLCMRCNRALGWFEIFREQIIRYVEESR